MIKKIFIAHILFMILCAIGLISSFLLFLWGEMGVNFSFKLGITFLVGIWFGSVLMVIMGKKYIKEDLL